MDDATSILELKGIGEKSQKLFAKVNIRTVGDLLHYYPRDYETFQEGVEGKENPADAGAVEEYILNEYGVVTSYTLEEYELSEKGERICARRRAFILRCADPERNKTEVRELIGQYPPES